MATVDKQALEKRKKQLGYITLGMIAIGVIGGIIYARKKGGTTKRYLIYGSIGLVTTATVGYFTTYKALGNIRKLENT